MSATVLADVIADGALLGLDCSCSPADAAARLGDCYAENRLRRQLGRDFGGVEIWWDRPKGSPDWTCCYITIECYRHWLTIADQSAALVAAYGPLRPRISFTDLEALLAARGVALVEVNAEDPELRRFWKPGSTVQVSVDQQGDVYRVLLTRVPPHGIAA